MQPAQLNIFGGHDPVSPRDPSHGGALHQEKRTDSRGRTTTKWVKDANDRRTVDLEKLIQLKNMGRRVDRPTLFRWAAARVASDPDTWTAYRKAASEETRQEGEHELRRRYAWHQTFGEHTPFHPAAMSDHITGSFEVEAAKALDFWVNVVFAVGREAAKAGPIANRPGLMFDRMSHRWTRVDHDERGVHLHPETRRAHVVGWTPEEADHYPELLAEINAPYHDTAAKMNATLEHFDRGHLEFKHPKHDNHAVVIPDASEPGRWRYSEYDPDGFSSHKTFDSPHEAAAAAGAMGYTEPAPGSLDRLASTERWAQGTRSAKVMQIVNSVPHAASSAVMDHYARHGRSEAALDRIMQPEVLAALRQGQVHPELLKALAEHREGFKEGGAGHVPKLDFGETAPSGERWITVHPRGHDEKGVPVLVRVHPHNPRQGHIIGGAGGRMNLRRLNLKTPEEYRKAAAERRKARRTSESGKVDEGQRAALEEVKGQHQQRRRAAAAQVLRHAGHHELADKIEQGPQAGQENEHKEAVADAYRKARVLIANARRTLAQDTDAREAAGLGELPATSGDGGIGASDLDGRQVMRGGLDYQPERADLTEQQADLARAQALRSRLDADLQHGEPIDALTTAQRYARTANLTHADIEAAGPVEIAAFARLAGRRLTAFRRLQEAVTEAGGDNTAPTLPDEAREAMEDMAAAVRGSGQDAIDAMADPKLNEAVRKGLQAAVDHGLMDPQRERQMTARTEQAHREAAGAPELAQLNHEHVETLPARAIAIVAHEAAHAIRRLRTAAPEDLRKLAEQVGDQVPAVKGAADALGEEALVSGEATDAQRRAFLRQALTSGVLTGDATPPKAAADPSLDVTDGAKARAIFEAGLKMKGLDKEARRRRNAIMAGDTAAATSQPWEAPRGGATEPTQQLADHPAPEVVAAVQGEIRTQRSRAFLSHVEETYHDIGQMLDEDPDAAHADLARHMSRGTFDAVNHHAQEILRGSTIDRHVVDLLGSEGAAKLLAWQIRQTHPEQAESLTQAIGDYHLRLQDTHIPEAMDTSRDAYEAAHEVHQGMQDQGDLREWQALNRQRIDHLDQARQTLGRTLGFLETSAALHAAMMSPAVNPLRVSAGPVEPTKLAGLARAAGLDDGDFRIEHDGKNGWLTVEPAAFGKLVRPVDAEEIRLDRDMEAIRTGQRDEAHWRPAGFMERTDVRPEQRFQGEAPQNAQPFDYGLAQHGSMHEAMGTYIAQRVHDGWRPVDIMRDLQNTGGHMAGLTAGINEADLQSPQVQKWQELHPEPTKDAEPDPWAALRGETSDGVTPEWKTWDADRREIAAKGKLAAFHEALSAHMPSRAQDKNQSLQQAEEHAPHFMELARQHAERVGKVGTLHHQELDPALANDLAFRVLGRHPVVVGAWKPTEQLSHHERASLREAFYRYFHGRQGEMPEQLRPETVMAKWTAEHKEPPREAADEQGELGFDMPSLGMDLNGPGFGAPSPEDVENAEADARDAGERWEQSLVDHERAQAAVADPKAVFSKLAKAHAEQAQAAYRAARERHVVEDHPSVQAAQAEHESARAAAADAPEDDPKAAAAQAAAVKLAAARDATVDEKHPEVAAARERHHHAGSVAGGLETPDAATPEELRTAHQAYSQSAALARDATTALARAQAAKEKAEGAAFEARHHGASPEWKTWRKERDEAERNARRAASRYEAPEWDTYVASHGGAPQAYRALQDFVRSRFVQEFRTLYQDHAQSPLQIGVQAVDGAAGHRLAFDPDWRDRVRRTTNAAGATVRTRQADGTWTKDPYKEARERFQAQAREMSKRQTTVAAEANPDPRRAPDLDERYTLGQQAEGQLAQIVGQHAGIIDPRQTFEARTADFSGPGAKRQRAIKAWKRSRKIGMFLGTGNGKTTVAFGTFADLKGEGRVQRGVFAVPSIVQGQFGGEALAFVDPNHMRWHARPGESKAERMAAYADPTKHVVVVTHQALRDDVTDMVAAHLGISREQVAAHLTDGEVRAQAPEVAHLDKMRELAQLRPDQMVKESDYQKAERNAYTTDASARTTPAQMPSYPVGTWKVDDTYRGMYGSDVEHLQEFDPSALVPTEDNVETNAEGRGADADRYAEWARSGEHGEPPPIRVVQAEDGSMRVTDGHRRLAAAKKNGQKVKAWVSYAAHTGRTDSNGNPMVTGLTHEMAIHRAQEAGDAPQAWHAQTFPDLAERMQSADVRPIQGAPAQAVQPWTEDETDQHVKAALTAHEAHGLLDYMAVDEGHVALNRKGKKDSHLARVIDSLGRLAKYAGYMTGTPVKNDTSELYDQLKKVAPHKYGDAPSKTSLAEFTRRYGTDPTTAGPALRAELRRRAFMAEAPMPFEPNYRTERIDPTPAQAADLDGVQRAYERVASARRAGTVNVEAARALAPSAFANVAPGDEQGARAVAEKVHRSPATFREAALNRHINMHAQGAKLAHLDKLIGELRSQPLPRGARESDEDHQKRTAAGDTHRRAGVIFAHNHEAVRQIAEHLKAQGHRVETITGKDTGQAKTRKREAFDQGDHDILILSDAGATGANLQARASWIVNHDTPATYHTWKQRNARILRVGQRMDRPDVYTLQVDHPWEHDAAARMERKRGLHEPLYAEDDESQDEGGLAHLIRQHLHEAASPLMPPSDGPPARETPKAAPALAEPHTFHGSKEQWDALPVAYHATVDEAGVRAHGFKPDAFAEQGYGGGRQAGAVWAHHGPRAAENAQAMADYMNDVQDIARHPEPMKHAREKLAQLAERTPGATARDMDNAISTGDALMKFGDSQASQFPHLQPRTEAHRAAMWYGHARGPANGGRLGGQSAPVTPEAVDRAAARKSRATVMEIRHTPIGSEKGVGIEHNADRAIEPKHVFLRHGGR